MSLPVEQILSKEIEATPQQVRAAIRLLDGGATVPFIARYRKEATGGLSDTHLRALEERLEFWRELESRRAEVRHHITEQGKMTDALNAALTKAASKAELEDIYEPFKQKIQTRAQVAREAGLEPLALSILQNPEAELPTDAASLTGARDILVERFQQDVDFMKGLRAKFWDDAWIVSSVLSGQESAESKFQDYFRFRELVKKVPSHRALAMFRGRQEKVLDITFQVEEPEFISAIAARNGIARRRRACDTWLWDVVSYAWKYKIRMKLEIDALSKLKAAAETEAIRVFAENLRSLLLAAPAGPRTVLGLDPGIRTGVKAAVVDRTGKVLKTTVLFGADKKLLMTLIRDYSVDLVAIGNGTASRETDAFVLDVLRSDPTLKARKIIVSEAGASVYSASELASRELPELDVTLRGAVSIARRLQDPLAELVKIDPKAIGVGQYQHDVNQRKLAATLTRVVEDCVNAVGVDVNTASEALLSYIAGLSQSTARALVNYRYQQGAFRNRQEFVKIPGFGPATFEQAAGFLRIPGGENPLDATGVHPESYEVAQKILARANKNFEALNPEEFVSDKFGVPTVQDILAELDNPGRDPRSKFEMASYRDDVRQVSDLKIGMVLEGTVTNVVNFGAFVDIGVHQDGLVHISEIAHRFVRDPNEVVSPGQIVRVKVLEIDIPRNRVALSMK